jgi:TonB family protein
MKNIKIGISSGNKNLDQIAVSTIMRVGHLPPIPPNYKDKDEIRLRVEFEYAGQ